MALKVQKNKIKNPFEQINKAITLPPGQMLEGFNAYQRRTR
jgi:hypothetical protein